MPPPPLPPTRPPDWFARNWLWFVPLICIVFLSVIVGFFALIMSVMKSSGAYTGALARVRNDPAAITALGTPIKDGFFITGNINTSGESGHAQFAIPVTGPKGAGTLNVEATKSQGTWHFDHLQLHTDKDNQEIEIPDPTPPIPVAW